MPEIRVEVPFFTAAVLDAYSAAAHKSRTDIVNEILGNWAYQEHHKASVILKVTGHQPDESDRRR